MVEVMFAVRKDGFKDHPSVLDDLDLVEEDEQFTHLLQLEDAKAGDELLNIFKEDPNFQENEEKYKALKKEILEEGSSDEESGESGSDSDSDDSEDEEEEEKEQQKIIDQTETNLIALRRTIYLTVQSSLDHNECAHKMLKMELKPGQEIELCNMILDCCAQLRTYEKFFGLLAQRFCQIDKKYIDPFQQIFMEQYETIHRLETNKLRNVAKFFSHLLHTDAISWGVLSAVKLTEEDTTSASRIFLKILFQELSEYLGLLKLNERLKDQTLSSYFAGILPRDNPKNTRFAINFFTTIGLGGLTDDLRDHLKVVAKQIMQQKQEEEQAQREAMASSSESSSDSSDSDSSSSSSESDSEPRRKKKKGKPDKKVSKTSSKRKKDDKEKSRSKSKKTPEKRSKTSNESKSKSSRKDKRNKDVNGNSKSKTGGRSIAERLLDMAQYAQGNKETMLEKSPEKRRKTETEDVRERDSRGGKRSVRGDDRDQGRYEEERRADRRKGRDQENQRRNSPDKSYEARNKNRLDSDARGRDSKGDGRARASDYFRDRSEERNNDRQNNSRDKPSRKRESYEDSRGRRGNSKERRMANKENQKKRKRSESSSSDSDSSSSEDARSPSKVSHKNGLQTRDQEKRTKDDRNREQRDFENKKGRGRDSQVEKSRNSAHNRNNSRTKPQHSPQKKRRMDSSSESDSSSDDSEKDKSVSKKSVKPSLKKARKSVSSSTESSDSDSSSSEDENQRQKRIMKDKSKDRKSDHRGEARTNRSSRDRSRADRDNRRR